MPPSKNSFICSQKKWEWISVGPRWEEWLKNSRWQLKKTLYAAEKGSERVLKLRGEFWEKMREIRESDLIFIDEAGVNLALVRLTIRPCLEGKKSLRNSPPKTMSKCLNGQCHHLPKSLDFFQCFRSNRWHHIWSFYCAEVATFVMEGSLRSVR